MTKKKGIWALIAMLLVLGLAITGCSSDSRDDDDDGRDPTLLATYTGTEAGTDYSAHTWPTNPETSDRKIR